MANSLLNLNGMELFLQEPNWISDISVDYAQPRLLDDYIYGIHANLSGYYRFQVSDLIELTPTNVMRVQLPASTFFTLSPGHDTTPLPHDGMALL
jgi:hypothetical protein